MDLTVNDPVLWFDLAEKIVDIVRRVHNRLIIHGEIVPKNILLQHINGKIYPILVDFGKSFQLDLTSLTVPRAWRVNPYVAPECRDQSNAWYTPADIYSLGGVLYYLATGTPPPDIKEQINIFHTPTSWFAGISTETDAWKNLIHERFADNSDLIATNEGIVKVIDKCLRPSPSERYASAEKVLQALNAVNYRSGTSVHVGEQIESLSKHWNELKESDDNPKPDSLFSSILSDKLELIGKELDDMSRGHYEIYGEREDLLDTLVKYIGVLKPGDIYLTVTVPDYWTESNLGINGRFLTVNKDLARNGVHVNRLFLISKSDIYQDPESKKESESRRILSAHLKAWNSLPENNRATSPSFPKHPYTGEPRREDQERTLGKMYVGFLEFPDRESVREYQRQASHVAIWSRAETGKKMSIIFVSRPIYVSEQAGLKEAGTQIVKVRFRELDEDQGEYEYDQLVKMFSDDDVKPLVALLSQLTPASVTSNH